MRADGGGQRRLGGKAVRRAAGLEPRRDEARLRLGRTPPSGSRIVVADAEGRKLSLVAARIPASAERRQPELVAGRDEDRGRRHRRGRASPWWTWQEGGRTHRSPSTASRRPGRPTAAPSPSSTSTTARSGARPRPAPTVTGCCRRRRQGQVDRLVARRQAAGVQHRHGRLRRGARTARARDARRHGAQPGAAELLTRRLPARLRGRCGSVHPHRSVYVVGVDGRGRRQLTTARTTAPTRPGARRRSVVGADAAVQRVALHRPLARPRG